MHIMKSVSVRGLTIIFVGVSVLSAEELKPLKMEGPAILVRKLFDQEATRSEREQWLGSFNGHYLVVKNLATQVLTSERLEKNRKVQYLSRVHSAILTVSFWKIIEAEDRLLEIVGTRLDPSTIPVGMDVPGSYFFPAAGALTKLRVKPDKVFNAMAKDNLPILTWVLAHTLGKQNAIALLKYHIADGRYNAATLNKALELIEEEEHLEDLLPNPFEDRGNE